MRFVRVVLVGYGIGMSIPCLSGHGRQRLFHSLVGRVASNRVEKLKGTNSQKTKS